MHRFTSARRSGDAGLSRAARAAPGWSLVEAGHGRGASVAGLLAAEGKGVGLASLIGRGRLRRAFGEARIDSLDGLGGRGIRISPSSTGRQGC